MTVRSASFWDRLAKLFGLKDKSQTNTPEPQFFGGGGSSGGSSGSGGDEQQCDPNHENCGP